MELLVKLILNCSNKCNGHNQIEITGCSVTIQEVMALAKELEEHIDIVTLKLCTDGSGSLYKSASGGDILLIGFEKIVY